MFVNVSDLVDEIIIVDTGSDDQTKQIARKYTDRVFEFVWVNDFSKARNYAFSQATQEYILWLDADDVILPTDAEKFKELLAGLEWTVDSVSMNYILARDEYGNVMTSLRRNRLVKREKRFQWIGFVHEYLQVAGNIHYADINITHDRLHGNSDRNLHIYENHEATGSCSRRVICSITGMSLLTTGCGSVRWRNMISSCSVLTAGWRTG